MNRSRQRISHVKRHDRISLVGQLHHVWTDSVRKLVSSGKISMSNQGGVSGPAKIRNPEILVQRFKLYDWNDSIYFS